MISDKMQDALNRQINAEMYSAYLYLAMSAHFERANLKGCAHWMRMPSLSSAGRLATGLPVAGFRILRVGILSAPSARSGMGTADEPWSRSAVRTNSMRVLVEHQPRRDHGARDRGRLAEELAPALVDRVHRRLPGAAAAAVADGRAVEAWQSKQSTLTAA